MSIFDEIWERTSHDDGSGAPVIKYAANQDLLFLYAAGFVDAEKYPLEEWVEAFKPSLQPDGSYIVTREQWMDKEKYYYSGEIREPFDPLQIPEKEYSEEEISDMFKACIIPSSQATADKVPLFINDYKERGVMKDGKMAVTKQIKQELNLFLSKFPSPLRILELSVRQRRLQREQVQTA